MANEMDNLLDAYLFETNGLLDRLEEILVNDEAKSDLSHDDVNEIFRIMHTTKSSSAMMGYRQLSVVAHKIEDLFSMIRDRNEGIAFLPDDVRKALFELLFRAMDYLRGQMEHIEKGEELDEDTSDLEQNIEVILAQLNGEEAPIPTSSAGTETANVTVTGADLSAKTDSSALSANVSDVSQPANSVKSSVEHNLLSADSVKLPEDNEAQIFILAHLKKGLGMENLRAFTIVSYLKENGLLFRYYPADMDTNLDTTKTIIEKGFFLAFDSLETAQIAAELLDTQRNLDSYEAIDAPAANYMNVAKAAQQSMAASMPDTAPAPAPAFVYGAPGAPAAVYGTSAAAAPTTGFVAQAAPAAPAQVAPAPAPAAKPTLSTPVKQNLISVDLRKLDELNNLVGEIVITESMVASSPLLELLPPDALETFRKSARQLRKLTDDLQDISMSLRMVSISGVFQKMNRVVRDMKTKLEKDVRLTIIGEDTEVDKAIVDAVQDPIMHLVRNCMDHGIEKTADERLDAGKPEQGEIILSASHTSSEVIISVSDDGYGLDTEKILDKAEQKGLLTKARERYSRREAMSLILLPGFSTNESVTEYSGRGVGMDVVKRNVEAIGGNLSIDSVYGEGTTITLKIPLTLAIVDGMKVAVGDTIFTISISNIRQSFKIREDEVVRDEFGNEMVVRQGEFYPIVHLDQLFNLEGRSKNIEDGILVWVEASDCSCCLFVDELIGQQQVVVKPLPQYLTHFNLKDYGISGCNILGDGTISIILDVLGVYNAAIENDKEI